MNYLIFKKLKKEIISLFLSIFYGLINKFTLIAVDNFLKNKNIYIIFLREERIGHQAGNADIEFYKVF